MNKNDAFLCVHIQSKFRKTKLVGYGARLRNGIPTIICSANLKGKDYLGDVELEERIILKLTISVRAWTGFN
jgi:hypothetical protein